jgi:hypothetical protein
MAKNPKKLLKNLVHIITGVRDRRIDVREVGQTTQTSKQMIATEDILSNLRQGVCTLFFYKKNRGGFRKMRCTLSQQQPVPSKYNKPGVIVVWDLDKNQWRSFYPERIWRLVRDEETEAQ